MAIYDIPRLYKNRSGWIYKISQTTNSAELGLFMSIGSKLAEDIDNGRYPYFVIMGLHVYDGNNPSLAELKGKAIAYSGRFLDKNGNDLVNAIAHPNALIGSPVGKNLVWSKKYTDCFRDHRMYEKKAEDLQAMTHDANQWRIHVTVNRLLGEYESRRDQAKADMLQMKIDSHFNGKPIYSFDDDYDEDESETV